jgi:ribonuclease HII
VSAGAAVLENDTIIVGLDDSKRLSPERREILSAEVRARARAVAVAHVSARTVDRMGIAPASRRAMALALEALHMPADHVIVDGNDDALDVSLPCTAVVGGDGRCAAIAAASIVAKVSRDRLMTRLAKRYPAYGFDLHKGYTTDAHIEALRRHGPCTLHRRSFAPCRQDPTLF